MKHLVLSLVLILFTTTASLSNEVEGDDAKNIVMNGEVLGMTLFDAFLKKEFGEEFAGFVYGVKYKGELYYCFNYNMNKWFCESI